MRPRSKICPVSGVMWMVLKLRCHCVTAMSVILWRRMFRWVQPCLCSFLRLPRSLQCSLSWLCDGFLALMARQSVKVMRWWDDDDDDEIVMRYAIKAELCALGMLIWSRLNIESQDLILCAAATWQPVMMWWLLSDLCCLSHFTAWAKLRQHLTLLLISCTNYSFDAC